MVVCVCGVYGAKDRRHACERSPMDVITPIHPCRWLSLDVGRDGVCGGCRAVYCSSVVCRVVTPSKRVRDPFRIGRSHMHARTKTVVAKITYDAQTGRNDVCDNDNAVVGLARYKSSNIPHLTTMVFSLHRHCNAIMLPLRECLVS